MSNQPNIQGNGASTPHYLATGVPGLDVILRGGFLKGGFYLLQGGPGSGKTTVGLQYLLKRVQEGERALYIALTESRRDIEMICNSHGWPFEKMDLCDLARTSSDPVEQSRSSIFHPAETELGDVIKTIISEIERLKPSNLVVDGLSELGLLAGSPVRYRRHLLSLKMFLEQRGITTLLLDDKTPESEAHAHQAIVGATIILETNLPQYGRARRRLNVGKVRSAEFQEGFHDYEIREEGLFVYPRLVSPQQTDHIEHRLYASGIPNLDQMFKGGLLTGTSSVFIGPSGVGKSTVAMQFVANGLKLGLKAAVYTFDEVLGTFLARAEKMHFAGEHGTLKTYLEDGRLLARQVDPAELTPGSFAQEIRDAVDGGTSIVVIDSLNGYINAMPEERFLSTHLHELVSYLNQRNVITIMVVAQHGVLRGAVADFNVSYLADTVLLFRYLEFNGEILRGLRVFKNRTGPHEHTMRQLSITDTGIVVAEPMIGSRKVATGSLYEDRAEAESSFYQDSLNG
jgi:circadian clock protein KaiC